MLNDNLKQNKMNDLEYKEFLLNLRNDLYERNNFVDAQKVTLELNNL